MITRNKSFDGKKPLLYLIATPIGNLKEISERALETLKDMDIIAAEDTRNTFSLLANYGIKKELFSLREHNEKEASQYIISKIFEGKKVAYVSDAGYPGISDPGHILVQEAIKNDISVSTISGSSAFINALVASGQATDHFYYFGFLSPKENEAKEQLKEMANRRETLIFYESPHRIIKTLKILNAVLGNREATIARELTKLNEEYIRGPLNELADLDEGTLKGEMVIVVSGCLEEKTITDKEIIDRVNYLIEKGLKTKSAVEVAADELKVNKNYIYNLVCKN